MCRIGILGRACHLPRARRFRLTDIFVRKYYRRRARKSERGTQHRAVELVKRAGFPGHCCTLSFLKPRTLWSNQRPRMYVMLPTSYLATMASTNKSLALMNKSPDVGRATKKGSAQPVSTEREGPNDH